MIMMFIMIYVVLITVSNHGSNDDDNKDLSMNAQITYTGTSTHIHGGIVSFVFRQED